MNLSRECPDTDTDALISYIYGESNAAERERIDLGRNAIRHSTIAEQRGADEEAMRIAGE